MLDVHVMVNWHLSKQSICWSHCGLKFRAHGGWPNCWFWIVSQAHVRLTGCKQGWAIWKLVIGHWPKLKHWTKCFSQLLFCIFWDYSNSRQKAKQNQYRIPHCKVTKTHIRIFAYPPLKNFDWDLGKISEISLKLARTQQDLAEILKLEQEMHNPFYNYM